jgi:hypothetical protein
VPPPALNELRTLVAEHRERIPEVERVEQDLDVLDRADLNQKRDAVRRIMARVAAVAPVLAAAESVQALLGG